MSLQLFEPSYFLNISQTVDFYTIHFLLPVLLIYCVKASIFGLKLGVLQLPILLVLFTMFTSSQGVLKKHTQSTCIICYTVA